MVIMELPSQIQVNSQKVNYQISSKPSERPAPENNSWEINQIFRRISIIRLEKGLHCNREKS
jgi:hypothetical protein